MIRKLPLFAALAGVTQLASPPVVREFEIPRAGNFPHDPAVGGDGIVWYTDQHNSFIGRLDPATGDIMDVPTPTPRSGPHGIEVAPDGGVWYTGQGSGRLGRLDPASMEIEEFALPSNANRPHTPIVAGGKVWFTDANNHTYGWLDPATRAIQVFDTGIPRSRPYGIRMAPDGSIWIALLGINLLGRVDSASGRMTTVELPEGARPRRLAIDSSGVVWYTDYARGYLGRHDPRDGSVREFRSPGGADSGPYGISLGPDGRLWFNEAATSSMIAFDPSTERVETVVIPTRGPIVRHMVTDHVRNRLWLALSGTGRIGLIQF